MISLFYAYSHGAPLSPDQEEVPRKLQESANEIDGASYWYYRTTSFHCDFGDRD